MQNKMQSGKSVPTRRLQTSPLLLVSKSKVTAYKPNRTCGQVRGVGFGHEWGW